MPPIGSRFHNPDIGRGITIVISYQISLSLMVVSAEAVLGKNDFRERFLEPIEERPMSQVLLELQIFVPCSSLFRG